MFSDLMWIYVAGMVENRPYMWISARENIRNQHQMKRNSQGYVNDKFHDAPRTSPPVFLPLI